MTDTPTIRTHATYLTASDALAGTPGWDVGMPVLLIGGLPEGAELVIHGPGDDGYDGLADGWEVAATIIAPAPVPAPPATETVAWHKLHGRHVNDTDGPIVDVSRRVDGDSPGGVPRAETDTGSVFEWPAPWVPVLVEDPAPDDTAPTLDPCACGQLKLTSGTAGTELGGLNHHTLDVCHGVRPAPANAPAPAGQWEVDEDGENSTVWWCFGKGQSLEPWEALPGTTDGQAAQPEFDAAYDALVDLVRRDRTPDPTTDQIITYLRDRGAEPSHIPSVLAAVRALREGGQ